MKSFSYSSGCETFRVKIYGSFFNMILKDSCCMKYYWKYFVRVGKLFVDLIGVVKADFCCCQGILEDDKTCLNHFKQQDWKDWRQSIVQFFNWPKLIET